MEYACGGDFLSLVRAGSMNERDAVFYASGIVLGLEYLHGHDIAHRDLKLGNILLDALGYPKIADFGFSKIGMAQGTETSTFCGTLKYMAPELVRGSSYTRGVDWWALGVVIHAMLLRYFPFVGDVVVLINSITEKDVDYPSILNPASVDILTKLLRKNPQIRLGCGAGGAADVKNEPFFKDVQWQALLQQQVPSPYVPQVASPEDTSHFDEDFRNRPVELTPPEELSLLSTAEQMFFEDFEYTAPDWL